MQALESDIFHTNIILVLVSMHLDVVLHSNSVVCGVFLRNIN